ncbi:TIR domain-containing protein [Streptomyces sp. DH10]|uniref:TIR domain-containing protein n=1 Tax=Streptomyces sp. DH10 TaxID=3040121 RepID=UPI002441C874|nr:TIR domain-containing protein [Streptomyces sp. DH10]MDG9709143.1 TIR domain-containing protein [Streptomyces sp. DH10]
MTDTTGAASGTDDWDVFISYAREDYIQAKDLYDALSGFVTADGAAPRIYLDVSRTSGTPLGADWQTFLEEALPRSRHIVALYSPTYFDKDVCQWELHEAYKLNPPEGGRLIPLLIHPGAVAKVPYIVHRINWISTARPRWIDEVCKAAGLHLAETGAVLRFDTPVTGAVAGHTLPSVRVTGTAPDGMSPWPSGATVTLTAQPDTAELTGTLSTPAAGGTAVFGDLAFRTPAPEIRLVATAPGCEPVLTPPFEVRAPEEQPPWDDEPDRPVLAARGHPVFFPDGRTLAVRDGRTLTVHTAEYKAAGTAELRERPRLWARGESCVAVADWSGRVVLAAPDGRTRVVDLPASHGGRLNVPGALAFAGDVLYAGMWGGKVWAVSLDAADPEPVLEHRAGVQVLAADGSGLLVGGLDGTLAIYTDGRAGAEHLLEPVLLALTRVRNFALVVGERHVYRLDLTSGRLLKVTQPVSAVTGALPGGELTAIVDASGQGVCFDAELAVRVGFGTVPGARPVGSGAEGRLLVMEYPDGSHALVRDGRTTYVAGHPMTVSPDGLRAAVSDGERLLILSPEELEEPS